MTKKYELFGFIVWFDVFFSHGKKVKVLSTSPYKEETHWKQTVFYLERPIKAGLRSNFRGEIVIAKSQKNPRQLDVLLKFKEVKEGELVEQFYNMT